MIRAESAFRMGNTAIALECVYQLLTVRNQELLSTINPEIIIQLHKDEFALEGERFSLLRRFQLLEPELGISEVKKLLPIPQSVIEQSEFISQNPGY